MPIPPSGWRRLAWSWAAVALQWAGPTQAGETSGAPLRCDSGSVSILVGGAGVREDSSPCRGFGTAAAAAAAPRGAALMAARPEPRTEARPGERIDALTQRQRDSDRRGILEAELAAESAQLRQLQQRAGAETSPALSRSRANVEALQRELALLPRTAGS